jgi:hypothetical protein
MQRDVQKARMMQATSSGEEARKRGILGKKNKPERYEQRMDQNGLFTVSAQLLPHSRSGAEARAHGAESTR